MLIIVLGRGAQFFLLFATIKISTTLLPPAEMAKVYMVASIVAFYALLFLNPIGMFMNRRIHAWNEAGEVRYYYNFFWLYLLAVCVVAVLSLNLFVKSGWVDVHTSTGWLLLLVGGSLLFSTVNQVVIPGLNLLGYRGWFVALSLATSATSLVAAVIFVAGLAPKAEIWICGLLFGQLVLAIFGWRCFFGSVNEPGPSHKPNKRRIDAIIGFAWPISIAVGLGWAQSQGYRFMMESTLGLHALGLFAAGYGISAGVVSAFESIFTTYLQPRFYKHISNDSLVEQSKAWSDYAGAIFPSLLLVGLVTFATAPELTRLMLGPEYWAAFQFIGWGVVAELARVASGVYGMVAHARMKTKLLIVPSIIGASSSIVLIWWLMPIYGSAGVGVGIMVGSLANFIFTYLYTRKEFLVTPPVRTVVKSLFMGGFLVLLAQLLRWSMGDSRSIVFVSIHLSVLIFNYLIFQYILLKSLLHGNH